MNLIRYIICGITGMAFLLCGNIKAQTFSTSVKQDVVKIPGVTNINQIGSLTLGNVESTVEYKDGLGRTIQAIALQASPNSNNDIIQVFNYDNFGQQPVGYLPYVDNHTANASGSYRSNGITDQGTYYSNNSTSVNLNKVAADIAPYSQQVFENSPLHRVLQSGLVGNGFQPIGGTGTQHFKTLNMRSNTTADNVLQWNYVGISAGQYSQNVLSVSDLIDEDGAETLVFKDIDGHVVLKRILAKQTVNGVFETYFDTYYIYDASGRLSYIIPPKAVALMNLSNSYNIANTAVSNLIYSYIYDNLGRLVQKQVPGAAPFYIIYDPLNRPVLTQDGNLRLNNQWNYIKYDYKGRPVSAGIYTDNVNIAANGKTSLAVMQTYVNSLNATATTTLPGYKSNWYETRLNSLATGYYTNTVFPTKNNDATGSALQDLTYLYYDDYTLTQGGTSPNYTYNNQGLTAAVNGTSYTETGATTGGTTGLLTMVRKKTVGGGFNKSNIWLVNVLFYDKNLRPIQIQSNNQLNYTAATSTAPEVVTDYNTNLLDFTGKSLVNKTTKNAGTAGTTNVLTTPTYDAHNNLLLALDQTYNSQAKVRIASYEYNEMGQLVKKNLSSTSTAVIPSNINWGPSNSLTANSPPTTLTATNSITLSPGPAGSTGVASAFVIPAGAVFSATIVPPTRLQAVDLRYNIRGQLTSINNSTLSNDGGLSNGDADDLFGMQILYDQQDANLTGQSASFSGRVSAVKWMTVDGNKNKTNERSYTYSYDLLNRLTASTYAERQPGGSGTFGTNQNAFDEAGITYDENSNILSLNRNALVTPNGGSTQVSAAIDQLVYTYDQTNPNQLKSVTDGSGTYANGYGFKNLTGVTGTNAVYQYDANGNLKTDPYKGITIGYNVLNKTDNIQMVTGPKNAPIAIGYRYINYTYDASGNLIRKQQYDNKGKLITTTDYIDGFVYLTSGTATAALSYFPMSEGRIMNNNGTLTPEFILTDQQGNARFSFQPNGTGGVKIIQENSYYAFGLVMPNSPISMPAVPNKKLYNGGAEWQNDYGNLPDYYQTFYRNYDPALGRFIGVDPLAEDVHSITPYQYANNNPITFNDPLGDASNPTPVSDDGGGQKYKTNPEPYDPPTGNDGSFWGDGPGWGGFYPYYIPLFVFVPPAPPSPTPPPVQRFSYTYTLNGTLVPGGIKPINGLTDIVLLATDELGSENQGSNSAFGNNSMGDEYNYLSTTANQGGEELRVLLPVPPFIFNLKKIGEAYYTNLTYEENFYDFRLDKFHLGILEVDIPSINIMVSSRDGYGRFIGMTEVKHDLAIALYNARWDVLNEYLNSNDKMDSIDAGELLIRSFNSWINVYFQFGRAAERTPNPWIGTAKSVYINLLP